jgi:16S rRNA (uracil1498-N3)-methyltransferase
MGDIKARVFVKEPVNKGKQIVLKDKDYNYLVNVMWLRVGDPLALIDGKNGEFVGKVLSIKKKECVIDVGECVRRFEQLPELILAFAPIKRIEMIAEKGTELGVTEFLPVMTRRTVVRKVNMERFRSHIKEAVEQCERLDMPVLQAVVKFDKFINGLSADDVVVLCDERMSRGVGGSPSKVLNGIKAKNIKGKVYVLVGPEGGFSENEFETIKRFSGAYSVSLGHRILRAETAVVVILALVQEHLF